LAHVTVLEQQTRVGGNAGSFELAGMRVDYGSHRLHPSCDAEILRDVRALLGADLLDRPRHGRIRLRNRWIHFPLKPKDLAFGLPFSFSVGVAFDFARKKSVNGHSSSLGAPASETFASVLENGLGRTICQNFYFPYVEKIWGLKPEELSVTLARRRVSANSLSKMARKILAAVPGSRANGSCRFFYPRDGYGQISEAYCRSAREAGAEILVGSKVQSIEVEGNTVKTVHYERDGRSVAIQPDYIWSTIPITTLGKCMKPTAPLEILKAAEDIRYRGMILVYLVLEQERFSEFDAHYFPDPSVRISRLSEPKNYSNGHGPKDLTVLCAELPCASDGSEWHMSDDQLGELTRAALEASGLPVRAPIRSVLTRRLRQAYPVYARGYEASFHPLEKWLSEIDGLLTFGRQGLFAHDNTHHALYMAYSAVSCLSQDGLFDRQRWQSFKRVFETHVVED
jgi:protoporphyrinogen oxidase